METLLKEVGKPFLKVRPNGSNESWVEVSCQCGNRKIIRRAKFLSLATKSCGCMSSKIADHVTTHGQSRTTEYKSWLNMKRRCYEVTNNRYHRYGGRGIKVCEEWRNSFENLIADMGQKPTPKHQLERVDNDGDYCKSNCKWIPNNEQWKNKSTTRSVIYQGLEMPMMELEPICGIAYKTLWNRIMKQGLSIEEAMNKPIKKK